MKVNSRLTLLTLLGISAAIPLSAQAATLCVEPTGAGGCHMTIQAAVTAAAAADTVEIEPAIYLEAVTIPPGKDGLIVDGAGAILAGAGLGSDGLTILSNSVAVEGLTVRDSGNNGIVVGNGVVIPSGTSLRKVTVTRPAGDCVFLDGADTTLLSGCRLISCSESGINTAAGPDSNGVDGLTVEKTTMRYNGDGCADIIGDAARFKGNSLAHCVNGSALRLTGDTAIVEGNKVSHCDSNGIRVTGGAALVQKNKLTAVSGRSIRVDGANPTILKNKSSLSGGFEIDANPCSGGSIIGNKVSQSVGTREGIDAECSNGPGGLLVEKNKVVQSVDDCFSISGDGVTVSANKAMICAGSSTSDGFHIYANNSTVTGNFAKRASENGFQITGNSVSLSGNKSIGNYTAGYFIDGAMGTVLTANSADDNLGPGYAVYDSTASVTLTGNDSSDVVPYCKDDAGSTVIDGMGNSFSLAAPPLCPYDR